MKQIFILVSSLILIQGCQSGPSDEALAKLKADTIKNMVFVEGGSFMMGDRKHKVFDKITGNYFMAYYDRGADSKPQHKVTLDSYSISKYEVTWEETDLYAAAKDKEKYDFSENGSTNQRYRQPRQPAGVRSWYHAKDYCLWLGEITNLPIDLPTEAQWEFAARSRGKKVAFATDNGEYIAGVNNHEEAGNYKNIVGSFPANPLGIHDMSSNVAEWVNDWYSSSYYSRSPENNPTGPETGKWKIIKGSGTYESSQASNVYNRDKKLPESGHRSNVGMRCVVNKTVPLK